MTGGVVLSRCGCCGRAVFVENRDAYERRQATGEAVFCDACMRLPEAEAERLILARDRERERVRTAT